MSEFGVYEVNITNILMSGPNLPTFSYQPSLRLVLPSVYGPQDVID